MSKEYVSNFPIQEYGPPPEEFPAKYTVPFEHGCLYVSKEADKAYRLVPLTELGSSNAPQRAPSPKRLIDTPEVHVWLAGPQEVNRYLEAPPEWLHAHGVSMQQLLLKDGAGLVVGLSHERAAFEPEVAAHPEHQGMDREQLYQRTSVHLTHLLRDALEISLPEPLEEWMRRKNAQNEMRTLHNIGAAGLAATATEIALEYASGPVGPVDIIPPAGIVLGVMYYGYSIIKERRLQANAFETFIRREAFLASQAVVQRFHSTYCLDHFDMQAESWLKDNQKEG